MPPRIRKSHSLTSSTRSRSRARPVGASNADASKRSISWSRTGERRSFRASYPSSRLRIVSSSSTETGPRPPGRLLHGDEVLRDLGRAMVTTRTRAYPQPSHERPRAPHPLRPRRGRAARLRALARVRALPPRARGHGRRELLDRDPAAERHRRAAHGPRAQRLDPGHADPLRAHARAATRSGSSAPTTPASRRRPRSSALLVAEGTSREALGREAFVERVWRWREQYGSHDHRAVQAPRRLVRLRGRALHARRRRTRARS